MRLQYTKAHDLARLHSELLGLPFLQPRLIENGDREAVLLLCGDGQTVYLDVPDDLTPEQIAEIERVIDNHVT